MCSQACQSTASSEQYGAQHAGPAHRLKPAHIVSQRWLVPQQSRQSLRAGREPIDQCEWHKCAHWEFRCRALQATLPLAQSWSSRMCA